MPTKEQKPLRGTKGTRQGPQTLADVSIPLLIWVSYTKERNTDTDIRSEMTNRYPVGLPIWMLPNCVVIHHIGKRRGKGGNF